MTPTPDPKTWNLRILRDGGWVAGGQVLSAVGALLSIRIMTELLSPQEFGRLTLLVGAAALAMGLSANPRLQAILRFYPEAAREGRIGALRTIGIQLIRPLMALAVGILMLGGIVACFWVGGAWYTGALVAGLLVVDSIRSLDLTLLNAARRQREASLIYVADAFSRPLLAVAGVLAFGANAEAALAGYVVGSATVIVGMRMWMRREGVAARITRYQSDIRQDEVLAAAMRRYAWPLAPLAVFGWLSGIGDRYLVAGLLSLQDAGLYAAAYGLASRPFLMLSGLVELTMRPVLQNAVAAEDSNLVERTKKTFLFVMAAGAVFGVVCFFMLSEWVGHLLLAEQYRSATTLMPLIAAGYALYVVSNVFSRFCYIFDDTQSVLYLTIVGAVTGIFLLFPAIAFGGLFGAAAATIFRFGVELALSVPLAHRAERRFSSKQSSSE